MNPSFFKKLVKIFPVFIFLFITHPLYSQLDIERATRETDRFGREEEELRRIEEPIKKPIERKKEKVTVLKAEQKIFIKKVNLAGTETLYPEDFYFLIQKYENKELTLSDLNILAKEIEQEYLKQGFIAAVFLPAQEIKNQTVTLEAVEARLGELKIPEHKYFNKERLLYYWMIPQGGILQYDRISQGLKLINKNPDREVKSTLQAGKKPGTTDVLLDVETNFPGHLTASFDNEGTISTGKSRTGFGLRHNNFLGLDDMFMAGYTMGRDFSGKYVYHNLPISPYGAYLLYGYSQGRSAPTKEFVSSLVRSKAQNTSVSLHQDLYRKDEYLGDASLGFEAKDKTITQNTGVYTRDRLRIFRLGGNFIRRDFDSITTFFPQVSQGVNALGASTNGNYLASRGARSRFTKFNLEIQQKRNLPSDLQANLKFKTQISSTKLTPQEEFSLGGIDSVRGYPPDDYLADDALSTSAELLIPSFFLPVNWRLPYAEGSLREQTNALVFMDYGWGQRRGALVTEKKNVNFLGLGAGVRIKLFNQALLRLEWGFPMSDPLTEKGRSHFHFSFDFQEKLPQEIERIRQMLEEENIKQLAWQILNTEIGQSESRLRRKLYIYLYLAESAYQKGSLKESKDLYEEFVQLGKSLYQQTQDYVRAFVFREKDFSQRYKLALKYYKQGRLSAARDLWQKILNEANVKPLILQF